MTMLSFSTVIALMELVHTIIDNVDILKINQCVVTKRSI